MSGFCQRTPVLLVIVTVLLRTQAIPRTGAHHSPLEESLAQFTKPTLHRNITSEVIYNTIPPHSVNLAWINLWPQEVLCSVANLEGPMGILRIEVFLLWVASFYPYQLFFNEPICRPALFLSTELLVL